MTQTKPNLLESPNKTGRDSRLDLLKALAIFLVVMGHVVQYSTFKPKSFFEIPIFEVIYTFHMPLFMLLAGYFADHALKCPCWQFLKNKFLGLVLPSIVFTFILRGWEYYHTGIPQLLIPAYWFINCLLLCFITARAGMVILRNRILGLILPAVILSTGLWVFRWWHWGNMYPFFVAGILLRDFWTKLSHFRRAILIGAGLGYGLCYSVWSPYYVIYTTGGMRWLTMDGFNSAYLGIYLLRVTIGLTGSLFLFFLFSFLNKDIKIPHWLLTVGQNTLGIYLMQAIVIGKYYRIFVARCGDMPIFGAPAYWLFVSVVLIFLITWVCQILSANRYTALFFLGKRA